MAFEGLSSRLQEITKKIKGEARITESNMKEMLREVKLALLEADVNYKIVKEFINKNVPLLQPKPRFPSHRLLPVTAGLSLTAQSRMPSCRLLMECGRMLLSGNI